MNSFEDLLGGQRSRQFLNLNFLWPWAGEFITVEEGADLTRPVLRSDVKTAVFDIAEDKAPGPDGYSAALAAWPVIGDELTNAVQEFFNTGKLLKQINATLLTLIPKVAAPSTVGNYRPISCCNVLYKINTKIIVQLMQQVMQKIVSPSQNAFVLGRRISNNILLAQEIFSGYNRQNFPPCCALKVDLRKAYDTLEWDFVLASLKSFGFPSRMIAWIEECISTTAFSVSLNGGLHDFFMGARGLRQGDPMSPYLFVLAMEVLQLLLLQRVDQSEFFQFHWNSDERSVMLFPESLETFAHWSGLEANVHKSQLIVSKAALDIKPRLLTILGSQEGVLPVRYLGLPLISSRLTVADCRPLLAKVDERLQGWVRLQLSFAARVQLIRTHEEILMARRNYHWHGQGCLEDVCYLWRKVVKGLGRLNPLTEALCVAIYGCCAKE
ncbi:UNVERIFIED_CONTAM: Retrovirus-related Pol polyprotein from type-2 retrotransposable element R2DM [Sesamum latifolium]|uniref:Retrovirus-related Pol polyprotein from type-2 retrotransposable element R2DM n=1 Tax=Sesamum latifolium TaxID=2727402 RepID=A0AAW2XPD9_9LAMI